MLLYQPLFSINPWKLTIFQGLKRRLPLSHFCTLSSRWTTKFTRLTQNMFVNHDIWQMRDRDQLEWPTLQVLLIIWSHLQGKPRKAHKYTGKRPKAWSVGLFFKAVKISSWWLGTGKWAHECLLLYKAKSVFPIRFSCVTHSSSLVCVWMTEWKQVQRLLPEVRIEYISRTYFPPSHCRKPGNKGFQLHWQRSHLIFDCSGWKLLFPPCSHKIGNLYPLHLTSITEQVTALP